MCLLGTGSNATAFLIDKQSFFNLCNLVTPTINELQECSTKDKLKAVEAPTENRAVTYPGFASFFGAPWLGNTIMDAGTSKPFKLIPVVTVVDFKFNITHGNKAEYTSRVSHC
jgi:hypothetical protein